MRKEAKKGEGRMENGERKGCNTLYDNEVVISTCSRRQREPCDGERMNE